MALLQGWRLASTARSRCCCGLAVHLQPADCIEYSLGWSWLFMTGEVALCGRRCYYIRLSLFSCSLWGFLQCAEGWGWGWGGCDYKDKHIMNGVSAWLSLEGDFFKLFNCCFIITLFWSRGKKETSQKPPWCAEDHEPVCWVCIWFVDSQWVHTWSTWQPCTEEYGGCHEHTATHTQPYALIVIPMSSDNIHSPLLSANTINTNPMWRGLGQEDDSRQSGPSTHRADTHTHMQALAHTAPPPLALLSPRRLDWGNVN